MDSNLWLAGEPNGGEKEGCVMTVVRDSYGLADVSCSTDLPFICVRSALAVPSPTLLEVHNTTLCPSSIPSGDEWTSTIDLDDNDT